MIVDAMIDTNVLVYAASRAEADAEKSRIAGELIERRRVGVSAQVLQEFIVTTTRKSARNWTLAEALDWLDALGALPCIDVDTALVRHGVGIATTHRISYWDGAILAAAHALGAPVLYTEDLNHGQRYGAVQAINPFRPN